MRILLTNDDGVYSPGIKVLAESLHDMAELYVVAPDRERSGTGHGITVFSPLMVETLEGFDGVQKAWVVDGTPADCVKLAISALMSEPPDLVISGINRGSNMGSDVLYSGTVSAAIEGLIMGVPSMAVSLNSFKHNADYTFAGGFTRRLCNQLIKDGIDKELLLNVNLPALPREAIKGIRITKLGSRRYENLFEERKDPRGKTYYWMGGDIIEEAQEKDSDVAAVNEAYVSITPIHFDLTDYKLINEFRQRYAEFIDQV